MIRKMTSAASKWTDLNFKVDYQFYRQFRIAAALGGGSMKALLEDMADMKFKELAHVYPEYFKEWAPTRRPPKRKAPR
jgi:hypothetical protein